jgi:hypothetical protein
MLTVHDKLEFDFKVALNTDQLLTQILIAAAPDAKPPQWRLAERTAYALARQIGRKALVFIERKRRERLPVIVSPSSSVVDPPNRFPGPGHWTGD